MYNQNVFTAAPLDEHDHSKYLDMLDGAETTTIAFISRLLNATFKSGVIVHL
jgi:hypothetical protein